LKNKRNPVISQQVRKFRVQPVPIAHLNGKLLRVGQLSEEGNEPIQKLMSVTKNTPIEKRKLKHNGTKLWPEDTHGIQELLQISITVS
jgi:hypothetical protein